ncbi:hypothetical protein MVEN_00878300 [Mycena venus]|uniref:Cytochrome P450 n=1 Tax=Mycena venus TaxID=2733690 RepID=A0A8H6YC13_9AGAR|nr:hypothetical protein MVEN_00878300 [Mycena venus]
MSLHLIFPLALAFLLGFYCYWKRPASRLPLPPGPKKLPLIGNLLDMPSTFEWVTYMDWSRKYDSDILHLNAAGKSIVVLSSLEAVEDLLVKRAATYSSRPRLPMVNELMSWESGLAFMKYGDQWRTHRRLFYETFNPVSVQGFRGEIRDGSYDLLRRVLREPDYILGHLRHMAAKIVMSVAYGIEISPKNDPYIALADKAVEGLMTALVPGRFLVDALPVLKYVPSWFPGAGFKRRAKKWSDLANRMMEEPYAEAKHKIAIGTAPHSFVRDTLASVEESENRQGLEFIIQATARTMYTAGTGTTVSVLGTFVLAMLFHPEAQKKAQAEIDSVVGNGRLPDFDDEPSLPYVSAVMKEVLRWINPTPIAVPHFLDTEDEYRGYRIPAKSIIVPNTHAILHDEVTACRLVFLRRAAILIDYLKAVYPEPYTFKPERYLKDGKINPDMPSIEIVYGFGRRICPGRHMADLSVWLSLTCILATFDITKAIGSDGNPIQPALKYFPGLVVQPLPFECSITPRSKEARELIQATMDDGLLE